MVNCFLCKTTHNSDNYENCDKVITILIENYKTKKYEIDEKLKPIENKLMCNHCKRVLSSKLNLEIHLESGICQRGPIQCKMCDKIFTDKRSLNYHIEHNVCGKYNIINEPIQQPIQEQPIQQPIQEQPIQQEQAIQEPIQQEQPIQQLIQEPIQSIQELIKESIEEKIITNLAINLMNMQKTMSDIQKDIRLNYIDTDTNKMIEIERTIISLNRIANKLKCIVENKPFEAKQKAKISHSLRRNVWDVYVGEDIGSVICPCCNITKITQLNFDCAHFKPESSGGQTTINNLRPICGSCNTSMGQIHMVSFMKSHGVSNADIVTRLKL